MGRDTRIRYTVLGFCQEHKLNSIDTASLYPDDIQHFELELNLGIPHNPWSGKPKNKRKKK